MGLRTLHRALLIAGAGVVLAAMVAVMPATATAGGLQLTVTPKVAAAQAASTKLYVYPPTAHPYGHTYSAWEVRWVQWWIGVPLGQNPATDPTGAYCAEGQSGPVWYLASNMGGDFVRNCTVLAGKAILISPDLSECSTAEGNGNTFAALSKCATGGMDDATQADVTVDGVHLAHLLTRYRFKTSLFTFKYPAENVLNVNGPGVTKSAADGIVVMLAPLAAGRHTLDLRFAFKAPVSMAGEVTYHLTVLG
jgi:hypothetical protein